MTNKLERVFRDRVLTPDEIASDEKIRSQVMKEFPPGSGNTNDSMEPAALFQQKSTTSQKQKAGHYEILGETLAKFEFFEAGWNPYERYLDVDKVDLILRRRIDQRVEYREIQVKYGKLHDCGTAWEQRLFDITSWRFFRSGEFTPYYTRKDYFVAYVLAHDSGYKGDIFIFPPRNFDDLIGQAIDSGDKKKVYLSRSIDGTQRWFLRKAAGFGQINSESCIEVTEYRRAFELLG